MASAAATVHGRISTASRSTFRTRRKEDEPKGIWTSLLESVSKGKGLDEKSVVILDGGPQAQKELIEQVCKSITPQSQRRTFRDRMPQRPQPPIANKFALGYTYRDITGTDEDDILCRLSFHILPDAHPAFTPLIESLFTPSTIPGTLAVVMLDWREPWNWMVRLRTCIRMLKTVLDNADSQCQEAMEETMKSWRERRIGPVEEDNASKSNLTGTIVPLGTGEWDMPLGIPLCVVCHGVEKIDLLETEYGWRDKEFDTVMQHLRAVLLRHGGSLIYTSSSDPGSIQPLIQSSLGIQSMTRRTVLKRNVADRSKVLIPSNWDTWGTIKAQQDGFDAEKVSKAWTVDVEMAHRAPSMDTSKQSEDELIENGSRYDNYLEELDPNGAVALFHRAINRDRYPKIINTLATTIHIPKPVTKCPDYQEFLAEQQKILAVYKQQDEIEKQARMAKRAQRLSNYAPRNAGAVAKHLGPVQFNVGGIQVNAEDALEELQERAAQAAAAEAEEEEGGLVCTEEKVGTDKGISDSERTMVFLASLKAEPRHRRV